MALYPFRVQGLTVVVNPSAGSLLGPSPADLLREGLPEADVVELEEGDDLKAALVRAARSGATALGVAGGDGSVNAAAEVAMEHGLPLLVVPGGTLNHLARDLGLNSMSDAVDAARAGTTRLIDVGLIGNRVFLNTASIGSYVELVDARESIEGKVGKWIAFVISFARVILRSEPVPIELDGAHREVWVAFFGNCRYEPRGIAPRRRRVLDDGLIDIRLLDGRHGWARLKLFGAVLVRGVHRCRAYEERLVEEVRIRSLDGRLRLATDGEAVEGATEHLVTKARGALKVFVRPNSFAPSTLTCLPVSGRT